MAQHNDLGILGEQLAKQHLIENGFSILEINWRYLKAEVDIIAQKDSLLVIVEVKTRTTTFFGKPEDAITPSKIKLLVSAANAYVLAHNLDADIRFDVIAVVKNKQQTDINHIEEAFFGFE